MTTTSIGINKETGLSLYRTMQVIRQCEERLANLISRGWSTVRVTPMWEKKLLQQVFSLICD